MCIHIYTYYAPVDFRAGLRRGRTRPHRARAPKSPVLGSALFVDGPASTCLSADPGPGPSFGGEHRPFEWGWRFGTVFPVSVVVGVAVPAAMCRWGLCPCCPDVGRCLLGVYNHHRRTSASSGETSDPVAVGSDKEMMRICSGLGLTRYIKICICIYK